MRTVLFNKEIAPGYFHMGIVAPEVARESRPGQFIMISVRAEGGLDPLLRRPMGIMLIEEEHIELLYRIAGRGTLIMSRMRKDETVDIMGPFGNGFDLDRPEDVWIVAGGCGIAPFFEVVKRLGRDHDGTREVRVFLGGRSATGIVGVDIFHKLGASTEIATEDGTRGFQGLVTEPLERSLAALQGRSGPLILGSGPYPMLRAVGRLSEKYGIECRVSLDKRMACGFGACLGCVVPVKTPDHGAHGRGGKTRVRYQCVCTEGPVFNSREIAW